MPKELEITQYKDFYWYAKGWYEESEDVIEDLVAIAREYSGTLSDMTDALMILANVVEESIFELSDNPRHLYRTMVGKLICSTTEEWVQAHLSVLRFTRVKNREGNIILDMGEPSDCLVLKEHYYEKLRRME